jgi:hypothetical protein
MRTAIAAEMPTASRSRTMMSALLELYADRDDVAAAFAIVVL